MEKLALLIFDVPLSVILAVALRKDWLRLTQPTIKVVARVTGHKHGDGHFAIFTFFADGKEVIVLDEVGSDRGPLPSVGNEVLLSYPQGHPKLARLRRPLTWLLMYAFLISMFVAFTWKLLA